MIQTKFSKLALSKIPIQFQINIISLMYTSIKSVFHYISFITTILSMNRNCAKNQWIFWILFIQFEGEKNFTFFCLASTQFMRLTNKSEYLMLHKAQPWRENGSLSRIRMDGDCKKDFNLNVLRAYLIVRDNWYRKWLLWLDN